MQPVLGFIEHDRVRTVHDLVGHLLAAVRGEAMHENGIRLGPRHEARIYLIALEQVVAASAIAITHRHPGIGHHTVRALHRLVRIGNDRDRRTGGFDPVDQRLLRSELRRSSDAEAERKALGGMHP